TKAQRVECGDRSRTHSKYITMDTSYPSGSSLKWFYGRRMIMGFNFKYTSPSITDIYESGIFFTCFNQKSGSFSGKRFKPFNGVFITAMFTPHYRIHGQFIEIGDSAQYFFYFLK